MDRVLDRLWIGSTRDFQGVPLKALGFAAVVDLRDGDRPIDLEGISVLRVGNRDGDPWDTAQVKAVLDYIACYIQVGKVLVACAAGMSRSASMTIGYLVRTGWDEGTAYEAVRAARPKIAPVTKMLTSVLQAVRLHAV